MKRSTLWIVPGLSLLAAGMGRAQMSPRASCPGGHRDDFAGAQLDRPRWSTVVRETAALRVHDGHLVLPTENTDLIWPDDPPEQLTRNIVLQPLPQGRFTATAKLALAPRSAYQQAGLVVYGDDDNYIKLVFQARGTEDAENRHFEFRNETSGESHGSLSPRLGGAYPDVVWLRLTSTDGKTLRGEYSTDGEQFTAVPETKRFRAPSLEGIATPRIGLLAMAGTGGPDVPVIEAQFDWFELCPAGVRRGSTGSRLNGVP
jgi:regulation of enolase protein 1 (concanavalin A-like superfamily)